MYTDQEIQAVKKSLIDLNSQRVREIHPNSLKSLRNQSVAIRQEGSEYVVLFPFYATVERLANSVQITLSNSRYILQHGTLLVKRPQRWYQKPKFLGRGRNSDEKVIYRSPQELLTEDKLLFQQDIQNILVFVPLRDAAASKAWIEAERHRPDVKIHPGDLPDLVTWKRHADLEMFCKKNLLCAEGYTMLYCSRRAFFFF